MQQIDRNVITVMTDDQLKDYLPHYVTMADSQFVVRTLLCSVLTVTYRNKFGRLDIMSLKSLLSDYYNTGDNSCKR